MLDKVGQQAAEILLSRIKQTIVDDLRIKFDVWTSERRLREEGRVEKIVEALQARGVLYEKDGARMLKTSSWGDSEDRVLVKRNGEYAYIAPDIAYHQDKFERQFDLIYTFVGADHQGHAPKLYAAMQALGYDVKKLKIVAAQWMRFVQDGKPIKLSKRQGNIYTPKDLIEEVGYDSARFFMLQHKLTTHMDFDLSLAKERSEKNPVFYVQYAYVRLQSILRKAQEEEVLEKLGVSHQLKQRPVLTHTLELSLMQELYRLPEMVAEVAETNEVHLLTYYALELAKAVHVFYRNVPVLGQDNAQIMASRLQLVLATRGVLSKVLDLLGISKPEVM